MLPAQHASPIWPHVPPWQPPAVHVPPCAAAHAAPASTHVSLSQQPPPAQTFPSQHGCPAPPHVAQRPALHERPDAVQKLDATPTPPGAPAQHACPRPPHVVQLPVP